MSDIKVIPSIVARKVLYRSGDRVAFKGGSGVITRIEQQANGSRAVTFHAVIATGSGEVRRSVNGISPL